MTPVADAAACLLDWEPAGPDAATGRFRFPADLPVFAGHFPAAPILPGVYHLAAILVVCARACAQPQLRIAALRRVKWLLPAPPAVDLAVEADWREEDGGLAVRGATLLAGERSCQARMLLGFQPGSLMGDRREKS